MQLFAFKQNRGLISAAKASKQRDYYCLECNGVMRLRGGNQRQQHFFHLAPTRHCRQNGKSLEHIQTQAFIVNALPENEAFLEHPFPEINRIADVAWIDQKIIFEVQCSPITPEEIEARNADYKKAGFEVVWILNDTRYNQWRVSAPELFLLGRPHYFTNIDAEGSGCIYDQISLIEKGLRSIPSQKASVSINTPTAISSFPSALPKILDCRRQSNLFFSGDLIDLAINGRLPFDLGDYSDDKKGGWKGLFIKTYSKYFKTPYRLTLQLLLEKSCR